MGCLDVSYRQCAAVYLLSRRPAAAVRDGGQPRFSSFPFNYEAVAYVAALFHPMLTCWALWLCSPTTSTSDQAPAISAAVVLLHLLAL